MSWLTRWTDRWVERDLEREKELVAHPERARRAYVRGLLGWVLLLALAQGAILWAEGGPVQVLGQLGLSLLAGWAVSSGLRRRLAYRNGWLQGRRQMVASMAEARHRGLTSEEWAEAELARDLMVLGFTRKPDEPPS